MDLTKSLIQKEDFRSFLAEYIKVLQLSNPKRFTFSAVSRRAGFKSRSFIKEVLDGKKSLSSASATRLAEALQIKGQLKVLYELLLQKDLQASLSPETTKNLNVKITRCRQRMVISDSQINSKSAKDKEQNLFSRPELIYIYSALGAPQLGATIEEIVSRTKINKTTCQLHLNFLLQHNIIEKRKDRFVATQSHIIAEKLGQNTDFKGIFIESLGKAKRRAMTSFSSDQELFLHSAYSINKSDLPMLKEKLKTLIEDFVDANQKDEGDQIIKISLSQYL